MNQWEYLTLTLSDLTKGANLGDTLNAVGRDGWELVAITLNNIAILKRPLAGTAGRPHTTNSRAQKTERVPG